MTFQEYIASIRDKRITVIGIGVSNLPLIRRLAADGCRVTACDRRERNALEAAGELEGLGVTLSLGENYLDDLQADVIFRTPGIRPDLPPIAKAVEKGAVLTSEMEAFFEVCPCRIVAVTGSDGKTTTTTLISELLKAAGKRVWLGGNIGHPLLCEADDMDPDGFAVVELSSFQLMTMHGRAPDVAVVTNLAPNHLDVHRSMEEYIEAKGNICRRQGPGQVTVLNRDNGIAAGFAALPGGEIRWFSMKEAVDNGVFNESERLISAENGKRAELMAVSDIRLPGRHNIENYMAAYAAVRDWVSPEILAETAKTFNGVEHRIEFIRELRGVKYYNDSIASSPSRTHAGLLSFPQKVILIAGGKDKGVPFDELGEDIVGHVKKLVLTGLTRDKIRQAVESRADYRGQPPIRVVEDFREAVLTAAEIAEPGDVVLLSPACTSFDRFRNFEERGRFFKQIVMELK
ncbi:MAG: UDP-N-acetylmuramoyl-L-alanine--D-glutamate ligase [Oscillospiraceae bacterium]|nr:UDP-N-acetylmuramoyl-L-alanine--D-glutamate ligase [Oscillospiraceae bacterium]